MSKQEIIREIKKDLANKSDYISFKYETVDKIYALLKKPEQKEVKDKSTRIKFLDEYFEGECPSCGSFLDEHSNRNFCGYCGQAVKWDE